MDEFWRARRLTNSTASCSYPTDSFSFGLTGICLISWANAGMVSWTVMEQPAVVSPIAMDRIETFQEDRLQSNMNKQTDTLAVDPCPLLRPFCHQVGGHTQFLQLDQSTVCKPLIPRELSFYLNAPADIRSFTPKCKGVIQTWHQEGRQYWRRFAMDGISVTAHRSQISSHRNGRHDAPLRICLADYEGISYHPAHTYTDGSSQFFLMLENVVSSSKFQRPCVLDLKMGTRQHGDDASAEKRNRQMAKCAASTSASLGLRLCGMKVYEPVTGNFVSRDKYFGRRLDADGLRKALVQFFASGGARRSAIIDAILERLKLLRKVIEQQETFRFYSSSLLIVYEGCDERCEFLLSPDFYFLNPLTVGRRSNSDCGWGRISYDTSPVRYANEVGLAKFEKIGRPEQQQNDFDSLSITSSDLADSCDTQSLSTSPQSVDSGLDCLMMDQSVTDSWTSVRLGSHFKRHSSPARIMKYEYGDNLTDSTGSGVSSAVCYPGSVNGKVMKRSVATSYTDSEEENDVTWQHELEDVQQVSLSGEEDGELTPVLEVSRMEEFTANGSQTKRPVMDEDKVSPASKADNCWADYVDVRMIDFAHTTFSGYLGLGERVHWGPDNGYLFGLETLTDILCALRGI
ncbi:uncharacterized protein LOC116932574 isoform X1 [Daphnia magna]|uniref:uncharacterized protein LOC116932574 isoform X1 n=1 Tax=Daphnia magna TaxID=35525 RepID=UPI001E1BB7AF|nr:uncharacterized protein LOC116932574 isoform X1 [Daphnia magna]